MSNKKAIAIIILAIIFAYISTVFVYKYIESKQTKYINIKQEKKQDNNAQKDSNIEANVIKIEDSKKENIENKVTHSTTIAPNCKTKNTPSNAKAKEPPAIKPLQVQELAKENIEESEENNKNIHKEISSEAIVITKEYKFQSPAKYSFK